MMLLTSTRRAWLICAILLAPLQAPLSAQTVGGDHIVAVVNQELVTAGEIGRRVDAIAALAARAGQPRPPEARLQRQALESLIDERVLITHAREVGGRVDDADLDRAVQSVAAQNQLTVPQLTERLRQDGLDMPRFRASLRDQILVERTREREVTARIVVGDDEINREIARRQGATRKDADLSLAQILIKLPENADAAAVASVQGRAEAALARVQRGEPFDVVAKEVSEGDNRDRGGEIGARPASRLPELFVNAVKDLAPGQVTPALLRSGAGFHILKLLARENTASPHVTETHARHILLRTSDQTAPQAAARRLAQLRQEIESGARRFEDVAREVSQDGSAQAGGDLGWVRPGAMVPEFEEPMNALPVGAISEPVVSRFGVHLIRVDARRDVALDRKTYREQIKNELREQKFEPAFNDWMRELRARAYIELRDPVAR